MNSLLILLYPLLMFVSCNVDSSNKPEEHLRVTKTSYRIVSNELVVQAAFSDSIWYQDSVGITQLSELHPTISGSYDTLHSITVGYRFVDMRRNWVYEYRNLSDTAEIVKKFSKADSIGLPGGWNFFRTASIKFDSLRFVCDTNINDKGFKKYRYVQKFQGKTYSSEALAQCDRKGTIFLLDVGLSNEMGCPMVKGLSYKRDYSFPVSSVEIEHISNVFPDSVRRVFTAWKRNVELYPVQ